MSAPVATLRSLLLGWTGATLIVVLVLLAEALPRMFGTGHQAVVGWGFLYVSLRFVVLPVLAVVHVIFSVSTAFKPGAERRIGVLSSVMVSLGYLVALYKWPGPWGWG